MKLELLRTYYPLGTNGELWYKDKLICYTIELPWKHNARSISCIPEGVYLLKKRVSKKFKNHLILDGVPGRDLILIHVANDAAKELQGCIAPVMTLHGVGKGWNSRIANQRVLDHVYPSLDLGREVLIDIKERI